MSRVVVLYNPLSGDGSGRKSAEVLGTYFPGATVHYRDITSVLDYQGLINELAPEDMLVICGGDGTLNRFINETIDLPFSNAIYYYPTGSGNDFLRDLGKTAKDGPVKVNQYIRDLPSVNVKGKTYYFLNGVGYGIDGYCCEVGERLRNKGKKPNYTAIAIKGLLFHYHPTNAMVIVDGMEYHYRRVWIAPTMHGCYYGGGMMAAPRQRRNSTEGKLSLVLMHNAGKIRTLCVFPSIFQGRHIEHKKNVAVHEGHDIVVRFDRPVTLQIDGEVIKDVSEYHVLSRVPARI